MATTSVDCTGTVGDGTPCEAETLDCDVTAGCAIPGHGGNPVGTWYVGTCSVGDYGGGTGAFTLPCDLISSSSTKFTVACVVIGDALYRSHTLQIDLP